MDVRVASYTLTSASGPGLKPLANSLLNRQSLLQANDYLDSKLATWIGRVAGLEEHRVPDSLEHLDSRNNRLADLALQQDSFDQTVAAAVSSFGAHKVGVIMGTSTSSVGKTEEGYRSLNDQGQMADQFLQAQVHNPHAPGHYVGKKLQITGPNMTISTACSSSCKVFAAAQRWLTAGVVDAVVVGGVDSLCLSILHGFASLELVSERRCSPFDENRSGINIGEAGGFALLVSAQNEDFLSDVSHISQLNNAIRLAGYGESADAYHMAHPHPEGRGAADAMKAALASSALRPGDIDYVSLHGTATKANDQTETIALASLFEEPVLASSTKGWTGHTLGAAGITGSIIAIEALQNGIVPGTLNLETPDAALAFPIMKENVEKSMQHVMVNSFGFGGSNCSLVFSKVTTS